MSLTLVDWQARLDAYLAAELKILKSQEYSVGDGGNARRNQRAELDQVQAGIRECRLEIAKLETAATPTAARRVLHMR
jgi:hypothetical protein